MNLGLEAGFVDSTGPVGNVFVPDTLESYHTHSRAGVNASHNRTRPERLSIRMVRPLRGAESAARTWFLAAIHFQIGNVTNYDGPPGGTARLQRRQRAFRAEPARI